ncbi:hypothetical protein Tsubulata_001583 [Turnera subulata]|uniref:Uncharacterized protein n=1 Tax=Turnera subulata TaxID=218843 RepID=A0A9Q0EYF9_9ROSI|nr:hypothetical protein Tsubulata_001583 [Turnera subulata]
MDLPEEVDNYIKETIQDSLGLPVSTHTLQMKLRAAEESLRRLHHQHLLMVERLRHKDHLIDQAKAEASMNAAALKKFVEENQRLAAECANLVNQCNKWERECSLYDDDRERLMEFGNEADERAKDAETRVCELEVELGKVLKELEFYKHQCAHHEVSSAEGISEEENLLESLLASLVSKDELESGHEFLVANSGSVPCQRLLEMWNSGCLRSSSRKVLLLAAKLKTTEQDKEHLRINLTRAEEEVRRLALMFLLLNFRLPWSQQKQFTRLMQVKLLFEENNILDAENTKLLRKHLKEQNRDGSDGKHANSAPCKRNKRKSSPKMSSSLEGNLDFKDVDAVRQPLSPLIHNSPDFRMPKK